MCLFAGATAGVDARQTSQRAAPASELTSKPLAAETASAAASPWGFALPPVLWLPTIDAEINYPFSRAPSGGGGTSTGGAINAEFGPNNGRVGSPARVAMVLGPPQLISSAWMQPARAARLAP